jgi:uncharacterized protein (TIGR03083 family)
MFWGLIVENGLQDPEQAESLKDDQPAAYGDVLAMFERQSNRLVSALAERSDTIPVWSWSDDHTVGFTRRRQAHEALIHRVDAELTGGSEPGPIDPELAADGIDEVLRVFAGGVPEWATFDPEGVEIRIVATDVGRTWGAAFGRMRGTSPTSGKTYDLPALTVGVDAVAPDAAVSGRAADLDLWLWGRGSLQPLTIEGNESVVHRLRTIMAESTQ